MCQIAHTKRTTRNVLHIHTVDCYDHQPDATKYTINIRKMNTNKTKYSKNKYYNL